MSAPERPRRRVPIEAMLFGGACLACCLPLLGSLLAAAGGLLAAWGVTTAGAGPWLGLVMGFMSAAAVSVAWRWGRRQGTCRSCTRHACAC